MYKTLSYLRSSACGRPGCWPGELGARERDRRSAGRAAGSEAIIMRACPAGRLARAIGKGERTPERRQNAARAHPAQAPRTQPDGSQNASDAWKILKTIVIFERCGFAAKKCLENIRNSMQQPRPGAEGAPRAAAHVLFMWAPGGVFSRRDVFWYLRFGHSTSFPSSQLTLETKQNEETHS